MSLGSEWKVGQVVQIAPQPDADDDVFGGCFMIVTEPKSWGAQGYVQIPGKGQAYYRCESERMLPVGMAVWVVESEPEG